MSLTMAAGSLSFATAGLLVIARLISEPPSSVFSALGILVHVAAFAPNLVVSVLALSLGATVDAGIGSLATGGDIPGYSLMDWAGGTAPAYAWLLLVIPVVSVLYAGASLHRNRRFGPVSVGLSALAFASIAGGLAAISDARVGLDLEAEGWARLSPDALTVFVLALGWAVVGLPVGRVLAAWRQRRSAPSFEQR
jgi:hypothetical protein